MKYFLIAGEASGDMHAANLMAEIKKKDTNAQFEFFGGNLMEKIGGKNHKHYREMAFMGILPVLLNLRTIKRNLADCEKAIKNFHPDTLILVDYPGFNLRMAKYAKSLGINTSYYISPKIWAWKTKRVEKVKAYVDQMYTILPFETSFYQQYNYKVHYVGNPSWDMIREEMDVPTTLDEFCVSNRLTKKPIIALLAGSRRHEISSLLPIMAQLKNTYTDHQFVIAGAPNIELEFYQKQITTDIPVVFDQTYKLLRNCDAAIVASGTATLETALLSVPQVVIYKMGLGWIIERLRKWILKTEFFSLVNLVAEKEVVKELFHSEVTVDNIQSELELILYDKKYRLNMLTNYSLMQEKIDTEGASQKAAKLIIESLKTEK